MLVDDHALVRSAVRQALSGPDIELIGEALNAEDALELAPSLRPDVMLVDITLPGTDGLQLVRELSPRLPETRFVMLTVSASERDVIAAMDNGASGFLTKDLTPEALLRAVRGAHTGDLAMPRKMAARLVDQLVDRTRRSPTSGQAQALDTLSAREREVLRRLADGLTDNQIADALTISRRTVETHVSSILHKLGVKNRAEAASHYRDSA